MTDQLPTPGSPAVVPSPAPGPSVPTPLPADALRWRCRESDLGFASTAELEPIGVVGQESAVEALRFGLESRAPGQNIFARGLTGTGRMTLLRRLLEELRPTCPEARDRCYVHDFDEADRPRLITLGRGEGRTLRRMVDGLADFIRDELPRALDSEGVRARRNAMEQAAQERATQVAAPFEQALNRAGLTFVAMPAGPAVHASLFPRIDGRPVPPEEFAKLHEQGRISPEEFERVRKASEDFAPQLEAVTRQIHDIRREHVEAVKAMVQRETRSVLSELVRPIRARFTGDDVRGFLDGLVEDVVEHGLAQLGGEADFTRRYRVNVVLEHEDDRCEIVVEDSPTLTNLLGLVDHQMVPGGMAISDHMMIRSGSLLRADGGYLVLDAHDLLVEPGAWKVLVRTLRTGRLQIVPTDLMMPGWGQRLRPEPIDLNVRVILIGDANIYHLLDSADPDFPLLFKVLADFDSEIERDAQGVARYAGVLARLARDEGLPPFDRGAVAALAEHGARIAARRDKLTARFGRLADLAREAAFLAGKDGRETVGGDDVRQAVRRTKRRADLPSRRFRERLADGTIQIETAGRVLGQVNGLAVLRSGPLTFGFPARITATIGAGTAGVIDIEREAALSGAIHTKGFYILGGLLRRLLQTDHPLAFDASIAFEQSYGGIDGDSASGAEICCLLSALTRVPLRQDLAMTGAIDQVGHIQAIGAVNEKVEGFYDVCREIGLTGSQGAIIPKSNVGDLMLREDVVEACAAGRFHVHAVETVHEALTILTGMPAGAPDELGRYADGTLLARACARAREFWERAAARPRKLKRAGGE